MPRTISRSKRYYRGGGDNTSRCRKWARSNLTDDTDDDFEGDCNLLAPSTVFPSSGMLSMFSSSKPPLYKGQPLSNTNWRTTINEIKNKLNPPLVYPQVTPQVTPQAYPPQAYPPQGNQVQTFIPRAKPQCTKYNKQNGRNVINRYDRPDTCDSSKLPKCTKWTFYGQGVKTWKVTGPKGEFCDKTQLGYDNMTNSTRANLTDMNSTFTPLVRPNLHMQYAPNDWDGGSRRKSRRYRK